MSSTKQWNLNLFVVMLATTALYTLNIRPHKISSLRFVTFYSLRAFIFTQLSTTMKTATQFSEEVSGSLSQQLYISEFELLSGSSVYWNSIFLQNSNDIFFRVVLSKRQCVKTKAKTKDGVVGTFPTQRPLFEGFLLHVNSCNNIQALHHTLWRYIFTSDTLT